MFCIGMTAILIIETTIGYGEHHPTMTR